MKRVIIGSTIMLSGIFTTMGIILAAVIYSPTISQWSGSRLWYAIFGAKQYGNEVIQSLFLGTPFIIGTILILIGLIILTVEYFK